MMQWYMYKENAQKQSNFVKLDKILSHCQTVF